MSTTDSPFDSPCAALVLGSDSVRLLVARFGEGEPELLASEHVPLRLAASLDTQGHLDPGAMQDALACVRRMRARLDEFPVAAVRTVATSTLRMARNAGAFLPAAQQALGHEVQVLSGEEEARLTCLGALRSAPAGARALVLGIGGGSTHYALGRGANVVRAGSLALGTVRTALTFFQAGGVEAVSFAAAVASARVKLADYAAEYGPAERDAACGASGTICTLARLAAANGVAAVAGGAALRRSCLEALAVRALEHAGGGRTMAGLGQLRLRDVAAALAILLALMEELDIHELAVADAGLRWGLLRELHLRQAAKRAEPA